MRARNGVMVGVSIVEEARRGMGDEDEPRRVDVGRRQSGVWRMWSLGEDM